MFLISPQAVKFKNMGVLSLSNRSRVMCDKEIIIDLSTFSEYSDIQGLTSMSRYLDLMKNVNILPLFYPKINFSSPDFDKIHLNLAVQQ